MLLKAADQRLKSHVVSYGAITHAILILYWLEPRNLGFINQTEQTSKHFNYYCTSRNRFYQHRAECPQLCASVWRGLCSVSGWHARSGHRWPYNISELLERELQGHLRMLHPYCQGDGEEWGWSASTLWALPLMYRWWGLSVLLIVMT